MADKAWDDMTTNEKLDALRANISKLFDHASAARRGLASNGDKISHLNAKVTKLTQDVAAIRKEPED